MEVSAECAKTSPPTAKRLYCDVIRYDWWCHHYFQRRGVRAADYVPFFGNILQFRHGIHNVLTEYTKIHGRVVGIYSFRRAVLVINDPDILKNVLVKNFPSFHNRRKVRLIQKPLNRGLSRLADEEWREIRNIITPSFSASKMRKIPPKLGKIGLLRRV